MIGRGKTTRVVVIGLGVLLGVAVALALALHVAGVDVGSLITARSVPASRRNTKRPWAAPLTRGGLPNLHKVSATLYRGAQPTAEGMRELKKMGVKTVVNLRSFHSDRDEIGQTPLAYEHITMKAWHAEDKEIVRFLRIVTDESRTPVFVHCQHGADRTGTMCAIYRIAVEGWTKGEAIREMTEGGYGFHEGWQNLIEYIRKLDIQDTKRRAGLP